MTDRPFDLIIFGVTGYTGVYCLRNLFDIQKNESKSYRFAVAGRNRQKIKVVLEKVGKELNRNLSDEIKIIEADVKNFETLTAMTSQCRVLINVVGPYIEFGRPVVEACIETGTHHVDLSGEPQFLEGVQLDYDEKAKAKGAYIVNCCGYDSIPSDYGLIYLKDQNSDIRFNHVESYLLCKDAKGKSINHGTFDSAVAAIENWRDISKLSRQVRAKYFTRPYKPLFALNKNIWLRKDSILNKWVMPFWETDKLVVRRTQMISYAKDEQDIPIQFEPYMYIPSPLLYFFMIPFLAVFVLLCLFKPTREFLKNHPDIVTLGKFSKDGPTDDQVKKSSFEQYLIAKGWLKNQLNNKAPTTEPTVTKVLHIKGPEIGYDATSIFILLAGITILEDLENQNQVQPGVLTPGLAFRKSNLINRLRRNRIQIEQIQL